MMKKTYSGLLCLLMILTFSAKSPAATVPLEPYLVISAATPPIDVSFTYIPIYGPDGYYPTLRKSTGKLYTRVNDAGFSLVVYDNAYGGLTSVNGEYGLGWLSAVNIAGEFYNIPNPNASCDAPLIPLQGVSGASFPITRTLGTTYTCSAIVPPPRSIPDYSVSYNVPSIVTVTDGNQIESVKVSVCSSVIFLNSPTLPISQYCALWADYFFGYRIGLFQFTPSTSTEYIFQVSAMNALTLPPPTIEGVVVEYNNTQDFPTAPGGHFFYSSDASEQQIVDSGQAGHFQRTGRSFNAGGYVPVCRFYGSQTPGPNSHFFSADQSECAGLKAQQKSPVPTDVQQWNSEGNGFYAVAVVTDANGNRSCLTGTVPVYRAYNNAYAIDGKRNAWDSNHRFSTRQADIDQLVMNQGWSDEGIAICAPN